MTNCPRPSKKSSRASGTSDPNEPREASDSMIEALKSDEIVNKVGGRFKLTALIQKRMLELMDGASPLIERDDRMTDLEVVIQEVLQDKLTIDYAGSGLADPD